MSYQVGLLPLPEELPSDFFFLCPSDRSLAGAGEKWSSIAVNAALPMPGDGLRKTGWENGEEKSV